jgi:hypothetical protein
VRTHGESSCEDHSLLLIELAYTRTVFKAKKKSEDKRTNDEGTTLAMQRGLYGGTICFILTLITLLLGSGILKGEGFGKGERCQGSRAC